MAYSLFTDYSVCVMAYLSLLADHSFTNNDFLHVSSQVYYEKKLEMTYKKERGNVGYACDSLVIK